jgi:hypothetical protein
LNSKKMITNKNNTDRVTLFDFIKWNSVI